jgi:hypothetical protein
LAMGSTIAAAAKAAGMSRRTAHRRLNDPLLRRRVNNMREQMRSKTMGLLASGMTAAAKTLRRLLRDRSPHVQLAAAQGLLKHGHNLVLERSDPLFGSFEIATGTWSAVSDAESEGEQNAATPSDAG